MARQRDERPALQRALSAAEGLKPGSWDSIEALALLAIEAKGLPECRPLLAAADAASHGLTPGSWQSARALALLARAERELSAG